MKYVRIFGLMAMSVVMVAAVASCKKEETPKKEQTLEKNLIGTWVMRNEDGTPAREVDSAWQVINYQEQYIFREDHTGTHGRHSWEEFEDDFAWGFAGKIVILHYLEFNNHHHAGGLTFYGDSLVGEDDDDIFIKL